MLVDPDGHFPWVAAINVGLTVYSGYKDYKSGKGWKGAALASGSALIGGGILGKEASRGGKLLKNYISKKREAQLIKIKKQLLVERLRVEVLNITYLEIINEPKKILRDCYQKSLIKIVNQ